MFLGAISLYMENYIFLCINMFIQNHRKKMKLDVIPNKRTIRWIKPCVCLMCFVWMVFALLFLQNLDKDIYSQKAGQNTVIINIPFFEKFENSKNNQQQFQNQFFESAIMSGINEDKRNNIEVFDEFVTIQSKPMQAGKWSESIKLTQTVVPKLQDRTLHYKTMNDYYFFNNSFVISDPYLKSFVKKKTILCGGKFEGYDNKFVRWANITIDSSKSQGAYGGEDINQVIQQNENNEFLNPTEGFFQVECRFRPMYTFSNHFSSKCHFPVWLNAVKLLKPYQNRINTRTISNFTIAIQRYDYANIYHSMNDIFNVFLLHIVFHKNPANTIILFADGHPKGNIDPLWEKLFSKVIRVRHIKEKVKFNELVWPMLENFSPFNMFKLRQVSYINHFRTFVLDKYGIVPRPSPNCNNLNVLFIWRHDYLSHPRNPTGKLKRKIHNERELFNKTRSSFQGINFEEADLSPLTTEQQIQLISKTDIIIGMHGAGLMLQLFLPPKGGLIELLPLNFTYNLFKIVASRIPLHYFQWKNKDRQNEVAEGYTYIPPYVVIDLLQRLLTRMCPNNY